MLRDVAGWATRRQHHCPAQVDYPDFIATVVGDTIFEVREYHKWHEGDQSPFQLQFNIKANFLAKLSKTCGTLRVEVFEERHEGDVDELEDFMDNGNGGAQCCRVGRWAKFPSTSSEKDPVRTT